MDELLRHSGNENMGKRDGWLAPDKNANDNLEELEEPQDKVQETERSWDTTGVCVHGGEYPQRTCKSSKAHNGTASSIQQKTRSVGISIDIT